MIMLATAETDPILAALGPVPGDALNPARLAAIARYRSAGLPTRKSEAWRYIDSGRLATGSFGLAPTLSRSAGLAALVETLPAQADLVVILNGRFAAEMSRIGPMPAGVFLGAYSDWATGSLAAATKTLETPAGEALVALNAGYHSDGFVLDLAAGVALERPILVVHWGEAPAAVVMGRNRISLAAGARAQVTEIVQGRGKVWFNEASRVSLASGSRLDHSLIQNPGPEGLRTGHLDLSIGQSAAYHGFLLTLGGALARQDVAAQLAGEQAFCGYSGAYLLDGRQEGALVTTIRHSAAHGRTREVVKGCLGGRSHGVFQGKILVDPHAQKTDAYQLSKTLLLGERAVMDAKPELEIHADDVKCSHGATIGDLDDLALFYLRSRGIDPDTARRLLVEAFVLDALDQVEDAMARDLLGRFVAERLEGYA